MADWLLLRLPRITDAPAEWLVCDAHGQVLSPPQHGPLSEAAVAGAGKRIAVLVPSAEVLITLIEMPARSGGRSLQVARYALEEQLLGDIDQQHFALGRRAAADTRTPVAVVDRGHMTQWLATLQGVGIHPDLLCAESALLPRHPTEVVALYDEAVLTVEPAGNAAQALCLPAEMPAAALSIALDGRDLAGVDLLLFVGPADWKAQAPHIEALRPRLASLRVHVLNDGLLPWLAPQLQLSPLNLLQGEWQPRHRQAAPWPRWRVAAALAAALLLLHVGSQAWALNRAHRAEQDSDQALLQLSKQLAPGESVSTDALRRRIAQLLSGSGDAGNGLLNALQSLTTAAADSSGTQLRALNFHDGGAELQVRATDAQSLERFNQALLSTGWRAELIAGSPAADHYEGRIQMKAQQARAAGARP